MISADIRRSTAAVSLAGVLSFFVACFQPSGQTLPQTTDVQVATAIQTWIADRDPEAFQLSREERTELNALYQPKGYSPLWLDTRGLPSRDARDALKALHDAAEEGLDPSDYYSILLDRLAAVLETAAPTPQDLARFDVALTSGTLRYLRELHQGRVDPRMIGVRLSVPVDQHDFAAQLQSALADHRITEMAVDWRPSFAQYRALRAMLTRYRALAADAALQSPPPSSTTVRPGELYGGTDILYRFLVALGDLPAATLAPAQSTRYQSEVVAGVKRFQLRHGLQPDGILDKGTLSALRVPLAWRVRQIELALERLRWLPHLGHGPLIAINIPMFRLWAWDSILPTGSPSLGMDVIVGRALDKQTPVFVEQMREVVFRPYWNVPRSILRLEILPMLERDPGYAGREGMEIVSGSGDDALPVEITGENIASLERGALRVRQRPGPQNALGLIKFVFPNDENVYMHGTPAQELFGKSRRDFSHGCVRVEDPVALAEWVLKDRPEWARSRILAATAGSQSIRVKLAQPIQMILFYTTAAVMPEDGTLWFAEDIYGHDTRLHQALGTVEELRR